MANRVIILCIIVFVNVCCSAHAADLPYKPGELIVCFAPKPNGNQLTIAERDGFLEGINGGTVKHSYRLVPGLTLVNLADNLSVRSALAVFKNAASILYAEPNYRIELLSTFPNDPNFAQIWGMHNTGQPWGTEDADIDAPEAWDIATDVKDIIVAVIDSGIDYKHPDLADNIWTNEDELNGDQNVDDDNNGYIDDIYGYDFGSNDSDPMDYYSHGTHCAGTVGAVGNNGEGVAGVRLAIGDGRIRICRPTKEGFFINRGLGTKT